MYVDLSWQNLMLIGESTVSGKQAARRSGCSQRSVSLTGRTSGSRQYRTPDEIKVMDRVDEDPDSHCGCRGVHCRGE